MATGYCEHCQQQVLTKREDINILLAIILTIFTAILGLIIYLAIWSSKPENRCVHCNSIVQQPVINGIQNSPNPYRVQQNFRTDDEYAADFTLESLDESEPEVLSGKKPDYCSLCGEKIEPGLRYCSSCGNKL